MRFKLIGPVIGASVIGLVMLVGFGAGIGKQGSAQAQESNDRGESRDGDRRKRLSENDRQINAHAEDMLERGRQIFRFDTYGSEAFFGDALQLHRAIAGAQNGGVGPGISPKTALAVGLKVDVDALPDQLKAQLKAGKVNLDDPATTLALLKLNAVVGLTGRFDNVGRITSLGTQCAFCHSKVHDSFAPGIGKRLDGWANRDLNVGLIVSLAPNLKPFTDLLQVDEATVKKVLTSWGPGCYDAWLDKDGKGLRPDGGRACTLIPPAFGLAGVNLHTWTGSGSVPYWNAYVAVTQQHGSGVFFDLRLGGTKDTEAQYPVAARSGSFNVRGAPDLVTSKLGALHFYQLAIPAPTPPKGSFDRAAAERGKEVFNGRAQCSTCHVPPLFTEPGHNLHKPEEIFVDSTQPEIDSFQARRSPTLMYRTAPLAGLWTHQKGGFYHDGRFPNLAAVIDHYDRNFRLGLTSQEKAELVEYLKSL
ncbi:MAG TPA: hypothetical protein VFA72_07145 [Burkholderiales bacterium]|nr:hypothetical protein [Burkholderiales bacterium]